MSELWHTSFFVTRFGHPMPDDSIQKLTGTGVVKAHGNRSRVRYLLKCLPHFVPMPPLLRSNAYSYIVQGISTPRSRHPDKRQRASQQTTAGIPTNGSMYSRRTVAGIPAPHTEPGRHVARCSVAVHNEALFILYLYLYLYIYYNIYINIKLFLDIYCYWKTTATLQRCTAVCTNPVDSFLLIS